VPGARVDDEARRLVDDEQVLVLVGDPHVRGRRLGLRLRRRLLGKLDLLASLQTVALRTGVPVDEHCAGFDQALRGRPRTDLRQRGQKLI
jgi:hypothetical protein